MRALGAVLWGVSDITRHAPPLCVRLVKVIVSLDAESFGVWEKDNFAPEGAFLAALEAIEGISNVETQTFTLMPL